MTDGHLGAMPMRRTMENTRKGALITVSLTYAGDLFKRGFAFFDDHSDTKTFPRA